MPAPSVEAAAPNWAEIITEPHCPLCEYMLRGLIVPRCPECGFTFNWSEVLDASKREHPYLFEHHPERNVWSFFKTTMGAMRPRRFWSQLHPSQKGSSHRLMAFWCLGLLSFLLVIILTPAVFIVITTAIEHQVPHSRHLYGLRQSYWDDVFDGLKFNYSNPREWKQFTIVCFFVALWPWVTYLALQIFDISMRKARVMPVHVRRCVIYALDSSVVSLAWIVGAFGSIALMAARMASSFRFGFRVFEMLMMGCAAAVVILHTYRLGVAYRRYLRFDHAMGVALSAQVITALSILVLLLAVTR